MTQEIENYGAELVAKVCPVCCIVYAIQRSMDNQKRVNGGTWYCSNGHELSFKVTEAEKLQGALKAEQDKYESQRRHIDSKNADIVSLHRKIASLKGQITKLRGNR